MSNRYDFVANDIDFKKLGVDKMTLDYAHPIERYDQSKYEENIDAEQAKELVRNGYNQHAFICNAQNVLGSEKCECQVMLAAPWSSKVPSYFKTMPGKVHTCNIKQETQAQATRNHEQDRKYKSGETFLNFFKSTLDEEKQKKTDLFGGLKGEEIVGKGQSKTHANSNTTNKIITRRSGLKTLRAVINNRYTKQPLDNGKMVDLNSLFHKLEDAKNEYALPDPRLINVWYGNIQIYELKRKDNRGDQYFLYKLLVVYQKIENRNISVLMNEKQIEELLPDFKKFISSGRKDDSKKVRHTLHLFTTERPITVNDKYEDVRIDPKWRNLSSRMYIQKPKTTV
ncbi:hypothetical protein [Loigolactobacillus zhaoyuanensis]|uniref:hypothetical protein n=1 Tax=Loigolactobacillus zhaoyuanensis TaxID=2486017 RepID=UPI0013DE3496|nr:hypothetical protein [Loigolactobacillus zhaoyuanensis]